MKSEEARYYFSLITWGLSWLLAVACTVYTSFMLLYATISLLDFTFIDTADFAPLGIVVFSFVGLVIRHLLRPYPARWIRFAHISAYFLAVLPPFILGSTLYLLAWRAKQVLGHWPEFLINDPKFIGDSPKFIRDNSFQQLLHNTWYLNAFCGAFIWSWTALLLHLRSSLTVRQFGTIVSVSSLAWLVFYFSAGYWLSWIQVQD